jgi:hypothetical protein
MVVHSTIFVGRVSPKTKTKQELITYIVIILKSSLCATDNLLFKCNFLEFLLQTWVAY